ncbi:MAG: PAS domain S-box protein [Bacteroidales bacterium]|nr:PAS domain S-box protein [Bacteroidales bacterium]
MVKKLTYEEQEQRIKELEKENSYFKLFKYGFDNIPNFMFSIINRQYCYEIVSKNYQILFNKSTDEIIGKHVTEIIGDEIFKKLVKTNLDKALNGEVINFSAWFYFPNTEKKYLDIYLYPVHSEYKTNSVIILASDLTKFKQAEELLAESEANLVKAQQIAHIGSWNWNMIENKVFGSKEFYHVLGLSPETFCATYEGYAKLIHPEDFEMFHSQVKKEIDGKIDSSKQYRIIRPNGDIRTVHDRGEVTTDLLGNPISMFGTIQDITTQVQAEKQYQTIIETAIDGFCIADKHGQLLEVNDSYCKMLGYNKREELLQLNFSDIDAERIPEEIARKCRETIQKGYDRLEARHICKDGSIIDVEISIQYLDINNGIFISFIRGITDKNITRKAYKKSEMRYQKLFEEAPVMSVIVKIQKGAPIITKCNELFLTILKYDRADVIGKELPFFYTKDSQKKMIMEEGMKRAIENSFIISERELVCRDGHIINVLIHAISENDTDRNVSGVAMFVDISSQKKAEKQLRKSHELLRMIVDGISDPLIMVDKNMTLHMMNKSAEKYFKNNSDNCLTKQCHQIFYASQSPCKGCRVSLAILNKRQEIFERKGLNNSELLEQVSIYPIYNTNNEAWAAIIKISDITRTKQIEKELIQADKMISLGILVSGVAHEINNPNNFIMLNTPILWEAWECVLPVVEKYYKKNGDFSLAGLLYSEIRDEIPLLFSGIKDGATRIQQIVHDLKNFAREDDADMNNSVYINKIIENSIRLTKNMIKENTKYFRVEYDKNLPVIRGNMQRLEQVIINLIQNACQALSDKGKAIFIASSFDKKTGSVVVEVRDEGLGIPNKLLNRIMDPFFTTKRKEGGIGLGLAVASNIVNAHKGKIKIISESGKGSVFRVFLPVMILEKSLTKQTDKIPENEQ